MSPVKKYKTVCVGLIILTIVFFVDFTKGEGISSHRDYGKLVNGCGSCHVGHGVPGTPMLAEKEEHFCYSCHGFGKGKLATGNNEKLFPGTEVSNIEIEFQKQSHHPVEFEGLHIYGEESLKIRRNLPRHSECTDCHESHTSRLKFENNSFSVQSGKSLENISNFEDEYRLCYKCHSSDNIFDSPGQDIDLEFDRDNLSFHPVEAVGKNNYVPSLRGYGVTDLISCSSCHGNNDRQGPQGPHGSDYAPLLREHYSKLDDVPEDSFQYALCYGCHSRDSILSDQSFPEHKRHIVSVGTSCSTCHNAHGSRNYEHLIDFSYGLFDSPVQSNSEGRLDYVSFGMNSGECYLSCHGVDHNPKSYSK